MQTISESDAQSHFADLVTEVSGKRGPVTITRDGSPKAVLLGADDYAAMEETLYLLSTPRNADRLRQGLADYEAGKAQAGSLCD